MKTSLKVLLLLGLVVVSQATGPISNKLGQVRKNLAQAEGASLDVTGSHTSGEHPATIKKDIITTTPDPASGDSCEIPVEEDCYCPPEEPPGEPLEWCPELHN